jgi:hypothetical protein
MLIQEIGFPEARSKHLPWAAGLVGYNERPIGLFFALDVGDEWTTIFVPIFREAFDLLVTRPNQPHFMRTGSGSSDWRA